MRKGNGEGRELTVPHCDNITATPFSTGGSILGTLLENHDRRWGALLQNWYDHAGVAWTPGMIVGHDLRAWFDTFCPWSEFSASMRLLAMHCLPSQEWIPQSLLEPSFETLLDFWEDVELLVGQATIGTEDFLHRLLCECADPPRFGTRLGRYPEQLAIMGRAESLLDLGCGVGLGTLEAARATGAAEVTGVTLEPLEAWMATQRRLPHDLPRSREFAPFKDIHAKFLSGDATEYRGDHRVSLVICNGLAGGRFLKSTPRMKALLETVDANLLPGGRALLANSFHQGFRKSTEDFMQIAAEAGWKVDGDWRCLALARNSEK